MYVNLCMTRRKCMCSEAMPKTNDLFVYIILKRDFGKIYFDLTSALKSVNAEISL